MAALELGGASPLTGDLECVWIIGREDTSSPGLAAERQGASRCKPASGVRAENSNLASEQKKP